MTILDLGFNNISDYGVTILSLKLINHPNLQILYLSGNNITSIGCKHLASLIKDNNHLQKLYLAGNPLGIHGAEELSLALLSNTSLTTLDLTSTNLSQTGFSIICSSLGNEFNNICELTLGNNDCKDEGVQTLANSLLYFRKLQILDLSFNGITEVGFEILVTSLCQTTTLTCLSVANNNLSDKSVKSMIQMIQSLNSLHSLTIDYNGFTPMGILAIINCLSLLSCFHRPFIKLSLCGNSMNTECAKALGAFLTHSNGLCLTSLHIDHMNIGTQGEQQIAASIASNQHCKLETLTGILLGPLMTELGSPPQLANFNNIQVLKYVKDMWSTYNQNTNKNCNGDNKRNAHHIDDYPDTDEDQGLNSPEENCNDGQQHNHQQQQYQQQSIGRKRAASIGTDENNTLSYSTNTQSEDDLTDLADDVQSHIRSSNPPASNNTNTITKPDNNALAETADETVIDTEQIRALMMKLEQIFDPILTEVAALPFDPSNLWTLHQYYYSPSNPVETNLDINIAGKSSSNFDPSDHLMEIENGQKKFFIDTSSYGSCPTPCHDDDIRPNKKQSNRFTMTRIAAYPRIKNRLEMLKSSSERRLLTMLRQLRCIEQYIDKYKDQYPYFLALDVESIILDRNGY